jgi:PAS domain S-box-containing protein
MDNKPYNINTSAMPIPALPDNMAEAIISTDKDLNIKSWNKAASALYGVSKQQVIGQFLPAVICFAFVNDSFHGFISQLTRIRQWKGEILYIRKDGMLKCIPSSVNAVSDTSGDIVGYVMVSRDEHQRDIVNTGLRGVFDSLFQYVGLVNDHAPYPWSIILHWHKDK